MVLLKIIASIFINLRNGENLESNIISMLDTDLETSKMFHQYMSEYEDGMRIFSCGSISNYVLDATTSSDPVMIENVKKFFEMDREYHSSSSVDLIYEILLYRKCCEYRRHVNTLNKIIPNKTLSDELYLDINNEYFCYGKYGEIQNKSDVKLPEIENKLSNIYGLLTFKEYFREKDFDKNLKYMIAEYLDYDKYKDALFREGSGRTLI